MASPVLVRKIDIHKLQEVLSPQVEHSIQTVRTYVKRKFIVGLNNATASPVLLQKDVSQNIGLQEMDLGLSLVSRLQDSTEISLEKSKIKEETKEMKKKCNQWTQCNFNLLELKTNRKPNCRKSGRPMSSLPSIRGSTIEACPMVRPKPPVALKDGWVQTDGRFRVNDCIMRHKATQVNTSAVEWIKQWDLCNSVPTEEEQYYQNFYSQPKEQIPLPKFFEKVLEVLNQYCDLTYSVHHGNSPADMCLQLTRKCWNTFRLGIYPARLSIKLNGEASYHRLFLPIQDYELIEDNGDMDNALLNSLLENLSVKGRHFYCPGLEQEDIDPKQFNTKVITKFELPYVRYQTKACTIYHRGSLTTPHSLVLSGIRRCRHCVRANAYMKNRGRRISSPTTLAKRCNPSSRCPIEYLTESGAKRRLRAVAEENKRIKGRIKQLEKRIYGKCRESVDRDSLTEDEDMVDTLSEEGENEDGEISEDLGSDGINNEQKEGHLVSSIHISQNLKKLRRNLIEAKEVDIIFLSNILSSCDAQLCIEAIRAGGQNGSA